MVSPDSSGAGVAVDSVADLRGILVLQITRAGVTALDRLIDPCPAPAMLLVGSRRFYVVCEAGTIIAAFDAFVRFAEVEMTPARATRTFVAFAEAARTLDLDRFLFLSAHLSTPSTANTDGMPSAPRSRSSRSTMSEAR